jgi:hypothetical protein
MKVHIEKDTEAKPTASTTETTFLKIYAIRKFPLREKPTHIGVIRWCCTRRVSTPYAALRRDKKPQSNLSIYTVSSHFRCAIS